VLIARSDALLDALYSILAQAREAHAAVVPKGAKHDERDPQAVLDSASEASTRVELARNVIIVLAEMADPANSRDAPELGASWAEGVVINKPWLVDELVRVMAAGASEDGRARSGPNKNAFVVFVRRQKRQKRSRRGRGADAPLGVGGSLGENPGEVRVFENKRRRIRRG
jgi:hypothetical protein